jgi:hypothetical protein
MANVNDPTLTRRPADIEDRRLDPPEWVAGRFLDPTPLTGAVYPWRYPHAGYSERDNPEPGSLVTRSGAANALGINDVQGVANQLRLYSLLQKLGLR